MRVRFIARLVLVGVICLPLTIEVSGFPRSAGAPGMRTLQSPEFTFTLTRVPESPGRYSLVISDGEERSISGIFSIHQLQILRAIMAEAEKFALGAEGVGTKDPITTRFEDTQEAAFVVDVEKSGTHSRLFLTLTSELGRVTADAGRVIRSTRREDGFFFDLLGRLESILPKPPKPAK